MALLMSAFMSAMRVSSNRLKMPKLVGSKPLKPLAIIEHLSQNIHSKFKIL